MLNNYLVVCDKCRYKRESKGNLSGFSDAQKAAVHHAGTRQHTVRFYSGALEGIVEPSAPGRAFIVAVKPRAV